MKAAPNPIVSPPRRQRSWLGWALVVVTIAVPSLVLFGIMSVFGLGADAAALRSAVTASAPDAFHRQIELRLGWIPLTLVRQGLRLADLEPEARLALDSIRSVEVGIYGADKAAASRAPIDLLTAGDGGLRPRGWDRVVGVIQPGTVVGVYAQDNARDAEDLRLCVLVQHENRLVVGAVRCRTGPLMELVRDHLGSQVSGFHLGSGVSESAKSPPVLARAGAW